MFYLLFLVMKRKKKTVIQSMLYNFAGAEVVNMPETEVVLGFTFYFFPRYRKTYTL